MRLVVTYRHTKELCLQVRLTYEMVMRVYLFVWHRRNWLGSMIFSPSRHELVSKHGQRGAPPISGMLKRDMLGKAMSSDMFLRDRLPRAVLDRYASFVANGFEAHFDLSRLFGREARLPPCEDEALAGRPNCNSSNLEFVTIIERRPQTTADAGLERELAIAERRHLKKTARLPPQCNFIREGLKGSQRICGHS